MTNEKILKKIRSISASGGVRQGGRCERQISKKRLNAYLLANVIVGFFLAVSVSGLHTILTKPFNKGIEFAGGLIVESECDDCDTKNLQRDIERAISVSPTIQKSVDAIIIKTKTAENHDSVIAQIGKVLEQHGAKITSSDFVSPQMTKTFIEDSFYACLFAIVCIGLYMIIRFNWRFSLSGIITLSIDVLLTLLFINLKQIEFCLLTLTALLTIIGYCINDKIVVFDRIRESLKFDKARSVPECIYGSVRGVSIRSVMTSLTTIIVAVSLLFFGDRFVYDFGIVVIFGIVVGTISSLFFAPSLLLLTKVRHYNKHVQEKTPMFYAS